MTGGGEIEIGRAIRGAASERDDAESRREDAGTAELVARIQAGEDEAFAPLYELYFDRVYSYLRVVLRNAHEAEDAAQQVFVKAYEALPRYEQRRPFRAWLFTIARNHAIGQLRTKGRVEPEDPAELDRRRDRGAGQEAEVPALAWISDRDLLLFLERLPETQRQVLALRFMLDLTTVEIAEVLDCKPNDVAVLQYRALGFLRDRLAAIGRGPKRRGRQPMRVRVRPARILRRRRFAIHG